MEKHPFKDQSRCLRRFHRARLKKVRKFFWGWPYDNTCPIDEAPKTPQQMDPRRLGKAVNTPQTCSCMGCGNQRHNTGGWLLTLQERRWLVQYKEQLEEKEGDD